MTSPKAVFCSFRFGSTDGVSVESRKWEWALNDLGFTTRRVAGEFLDGIRPDDTWLSFLSIDPAPGSQTEPSALAAAIAGADLVVVENLCSLPLNLNASRTAADVLKRHAGRVIFHHHDLPWERSQFARLSEFPPIRKDSAHVVINEHARKEMAIRKIDSFLIRNSFDLNPELGNREQTRKQMGFASDDVVILQPTRAIPRKEVGRAIALADSVSERWPDRNVRFWITGKTEDGFDEELARLIEHARVSITQGSVERVEDAYAAADLVVLPSSWEGFGNPIIEATVAGRAVVVAHYPVLDELTEIGMKFLDIDDLEGILEELSSPSSKMVTNNLACARQYFNLEDLPNQITKMFTEIGWTQW